MDSSFSIDKLIGVHCTHGLNRTGFLMCRYMIEEMKMSPLDAIAGMSREYSNRYAVPDL